MRLGRVIVGAVALEVILAATFTILIFVWPGPGSILAVLGPLTTFAVAYLVGVWAARRFPSRFALHGALIGVFATVLYLLWLVVSVGIPVAITMQGGPARFYLGQAIRIVGCVTGAMVRGRKNRWTALSEGR